MYRTAAAHRHHHHYPRRTVQAPLGTAKTAWTGQSEFCYVLFLARLDRGAAERDEVMIHGHELSGSLMYVGKPCSSVDSQLLTRC